MSTKTFHNADQEVVTYDGSPITWRVSAYVVIVRDEKVLIIKNKTEKLFDIPGGGVEINERIEEALHREAMEEAGVKINIGKLLHVSEDWFQYKTGTFHHTIQLFYSAELLGELEIPTEEDTDLVQFIDIDQVKKFPLPPPALEAIMKKIASV